MIQLCLRADTTIIAVEPACLVLEHRGRRMTLDGISGLCEAFRRLAAGNHDLDEMMLALPGPPGARCGTRIALRRFGLALRMLAARQLVEFRCTDGPRILLTAVPTGLLASFDFWPPGTDHPSSAGLAVDRFQLSRFACAHQVGGDLIVEVPHKSMRVSVHQAEMGGLLALLSRPTTVERATRELSGRPAAVVRECLRFLAATGVAGLLDAAGHLAEDRDPCLSLREFHDVLMHAAIRDGLTDAPTGAAFPFAGVVPPLPAVKPEMSGELIRLPIPDVARMTAADPPLVTVMEQRRSVRRYGEPLTVGQLGEFLYRIGRVRSISGPDQANPKAYETSNRTYPSAGGAYDLEIYPVVRECAGIPAGMYHYQPAEHALSALRPREAYLRRLLYRAYTANGRQVVPQILLVIASRFGRLSWKYRGIAYANTLRDVGVLYEAMYLAAMAMGLAPCALGTGNSGAFGAATRLDPLVESSVGEFMLGTLPAGDDG